MPSSSGGGLESMPTGGAYTTTEATMVMRNGRVEFEPLRVVDNNENRLQEEIYRRTMSTSFFETITPKPKKKDTPNVHQAGKKLLVRGFNYGTGLEIVNEASPSGADYTFYEVVIERIVIPKGKRQEIKFSNGMAYLDSAVDELLA